MKPLIKQILKGPARYYMAMHLKRRGHQIELVKLCGKRCGLIIHELAHTILDALATSDITGHLRAWWEMVSGQVDAA